MGALKLKRGSVVVVVIPGDLGKPRPALVVQSDLADPAFATVTVLPITSDLRSTPLYRITVDPTTANGLATISQVEIDKCSTIARRKIGQVVGQLEEPTMIRVHRGLALWLGLV